MSDAGTDTRRRIVEATTTLLRRQGYAATGLQQIATESSARVGSIYHFFDGKEALTEVSIRTSGAAYGAMVMTLLAEGPDDPVDALGAAFARAAEDLVASDYADACPIATVALEVASTNEPLRQATADVFATWVDALTAWCLELVHHPGEARDLATAILSALEGGFLLCRASRDPEPLLSAGRSMSRLARSMSEGQSVSPSPR